MEPSDQFQAVAGLPLDNESAVRPEDLSIHPFSESFRMAIVRQFRGLRELSEERLAVAILDGEDNRAHDRIRELVRPHGTGCRYSNGTRCGFPRRHGRLRHKPGNPRESCSAEFPSKKRREV